MTTTIPYNMEWSNIYNREAYNKIRSVMNLYFLKYPKKLIQNYKIEFTYDKKRDLNEATDVTAIISNKIDIAMRLRD